jgi:hypothetical protein
MSSPGVPGSPAAGYSCSLSAAAGYSSPLSATTTTTTTASISRAAIPPTLSGYSCSLSAAAGYSSPLSATTTTTTTASISRAAIPPTLSGYSCSLSAAAGYSSPLSATTTTTTTASISRAAIPPTLSGYSCSLSAAAGYSSPLSATTTTTTTASISRAAIPPTLPTTAVTFPPLMIQLPLTDAVQKQIQEAVSAGEFSKENRTFITEICTEYGNRLSHSKFPGLFFSFETEKDAENQLRNAKLCEKIVKEQDLHCITVPKQQIVRLEDSRYALFVTEAPIGRYSLVSSKSQEKLEQTYEAMKSSPDLQAKVIEFFRQLAVLTCKVDIFINPKTEALQTEPCCNLTLLRFDRGIQRPEFPFALLLGSAPVEAWDAIYEVAGQNNFEIRHKRDIFRPFFQPQCEMRATAQKRRASELAVHSLVRKWHSEQGITTPEQNRPPVIKRTPEEQASLSNQAKIMDAIARDVDYKHSRGSLVLQRCLYHFLTVEENDVEACIDEFEYALGKLKANKKICAWISERCDNGSIAYAIYF